MNSAYSDDSGLGLSRERVSKEACSKRWLLLITLAQVALVVPYVTKILPWCFENGLFPVRPVFYLLVVGAINFGMVILKGPDFTKTHLLILLLIGWRAFDAAILQRFHFPGDHGVFINGLLAAVVMGVCLYCVLGIVHRTSTKPILAVAICSIAGCVGGIFLELLGVFKETTVDGRFAGFVGDPNRACVVMCLMLGVVLSISKNFWLNIGTIGLTAAGVFPTYSRGGMLMLVLISAAFVFLNFRKYMNRFVICAVIAAPLVIAAAGFLAAKTSEGGKKDENTASRFAAIFSGDFSKMKSSEREKDLHDGLNAAMSNPVLGIGTGAGTNLYQPHNQMVTTWLDLGIGGLMLYASILGLMVWKCIKSKLKAVYVVIPILLYFPLSQSLLENYAYLYAMGVALVLMSDRFLCLRVLRAAVPKQTKMVHSHS